MYKAFGLYQNIQISIKKPAIAGKILESIFPKSAKQCFSPI